jgi:hypothetical protein
LGDSMSTFNNPPFFDGEQLASATINAKAGTNLQNAVNDLDESSIERHALDAQHLPSLAMSDIFSNGFEAGPNALGAGVTAASIISGEEYENTLPLYAVTQYPYTYQTFDGLSGGTAKAYYGPTDWPTVNHIEAGWRIPSEPGWVGSPSYPAEVTLASATNFDTAKIKGVLCRGSVQPISSSRTTKVTGTLVSDYDTAVALAIGFEDGLGARYVVERSVRFFTERAVRPGNADTMTFLTQSDLNAGNGTCAKIFLAIATAHPGDTSWTALSGTRNQDNNNLRIRYYNLSTTPIHAGDL